MRLTALLVLVLSACGSSSSTDTPTAATAAALLAKTGAKATSTAYMAGPDTKNECAVGAAEADGILGAGNYVYVCIFPSNADMLSYIKDGTLYAAGAALIQVGQSTLVEVDGLSIDPPPASLTKTIADRVGGSVYS